MFAQENDYMVPFSPDRPSAAPANSIPEDPSSGTSEVTAMTSEIARVLAAGVEIGEASTAATPGPTGTTASTPDVSPVAGGGGGSGGGALLAEVPGMKEFCFSDDDDTEGEEIRDKERDTTKLTDDVIGVSDDDQAEKEQCDSNSTPAVGGGADSVEKGAVVDGREEGQKQARLRRRRGQRTKDGDHGDGSEDLSSGSDNGGGSESAAERKRRRDHLEVLLNPLGLPHGGRHEDDSSDGNRTPPPGGIRGVVDSACATPAPGAWAAPDFVFSSDDDLDIEFSASERSLERSVERSWSRSPNTEKEASK